MAPCSQASPGPPPQSLRPRAVEASYCGPITILSWCLTQRHSGVEGVWCKAMWNLVEYWNPVGCGVREEQVTHGELYLQQMLFRENISIHCSCTSGVRKKEQLGQRCFLLVPCYDLLPIVWSNCSSVVSAKQNTLCPKRGEGSYPFWTELSAWPNMQDFGLHARTSGFYTHSGKIVYLCM